jgi:hypothetical protein
MKYVPWWWLTLTACAIVISVCLSPVLGEARDIICFLIGFVGGCAGAYLDMRRWNII